MSRLTATEGERMSGLTGADRPLVLGWVADALDGVAVPQAISALLRKAAATEDEPLVPEAVVGAAR